MINTQTQLKQVHDKRQAFKESEELKVPQHNLIKRANT